jgi:hypothetical protein
MSEQGREEMETRRHVAPVDAVEDFGGSGFERQAAHGSHAASPGVEEPSENASRSTEVVRRSPAHPSEEGQA